MLKEIQAAGPASGSVAAVRRPVLRLKLSKTFGGTRALRDVALEIQLPARSTRSSPNGFGKSTLIKTRWPVITTPTPARSPGWMASRSTSRR